MIRPFNLRDLALIRRLSDQGTLLHAESALTKSCQPLRGALLSMITRGDPATYVWRAEGSHSAGFVQMQLAEDRPYAHLVCLGATPTQNDGKEAEELNEEAWLSLLDGAVAAVGRRGVHSLIAEVPETGPELPLLRQAGFVVYTRQDIWALASGAPSSSSVLLQPRKSVDDWDVEWLYANTVPPMVQLVEPSPPREGSIWILREEGELMAFAHVHEGPAATWLQLFIHPNANTQATEIVAAAVQVGEVHEEHPVYCCVRRYQSWLHQPLKEVGFEFCESQAVLVKHVASPTQKRVGELSKLLQAQRVYPTTLMEEASLERVGSREG